MISLLCLCFAAIINSIMDILAQKFEQSLFITYPHQFWNPEISWKNKYKDGDPLQGEKFPMSTTLLVAFTDGWHLMKSFYLLAVMIAVCQYTPIYEPLADFFIYGISYRVIFEMFYRFLHK